MRIDIETVNLIQYLRRMINQTPLEEIEWYSEGKQLIPPPETIKEFNYIGLSNIQFVTCDYKDWREDWPVNAVPSRERREYLRDGVEDFFIDNKDILSRLAELTKEIYKEEN